MSDEDVCAENSLPKKGVKLSYTEILALFKKRRNEADVLLPVMDKLSSAEVSLKEAKVCMSIGPGGGQNDLDFVQRCLPNLEKYIAVDKNQSCLKLLRVNFKKIFGESVEFETHEADAVDLEWRQERVDVVLMSHMLYTVPEAKRLTMFDNCLKRILKRKNGMIIFVNNTEENFFQKLHLKLEISPLPGSAEIKENFVKVGGRIAWSHVYSCEIFVAEYGHDLWYYTMEFSDRVLTPVEIMDAIKFISPNGKSDYQCEICVVKDNGSE